MNRLQIDTFRIQFQTQKLDLLEIARNVLARKGPISKWSVNLDTGEARRGSKTIFFYPSSQGAFSPNSFWFMGGQEIETKADCNQIEDAYAWIFLARMEEQTLHRTDRLDAEQKNFSQSLSTKLCSTTETTN